MPSYSAGLPELQYFVLIASTVAEADLSGCDLMTFVRQNCHRRDANDWTSHGFNPLESRSMGFSGI